MEDAGPFFFSSAEHDRRDITDTRSLPSLRPSNEIRGKPCFFIFSISRAFLSALSATLR